jgi:hypothetical protein
MALQLVNIGLAPNDGLGDPLRTAFSKINSNFQEVYRGTSNNYFVTKNGSDSNPGDSPDQAFLTIKKAVDAAAAFISGNPTQRVCIFVSAGEYVEDNPVTLPPNCSIVGDSLRSVSVRPVNTTQDIFHVQNADYIAGMTFRGHVSPAAAVAFKTAGGGAGAITTSPYVQNCSSITTTGTGMRIDGNLASGLKSMVTDAFTQINEGGIGIHILNQGYAQLVSIFTVCCNQGILCESGATCSITNSNTSFGTFGLVANGKVTVSLTGLSNGVNQAGNLVAVDGLTSRPNVNQSVSFDGGVTLYNIWNATDLVSGQSILLLDRDLAAPLPDNTPATFYVRSQINASSHTFEYVGTGDVLVNALPQTGARPIPGNEVRQSNGGQVIYTSTDQRGDFKIGDQLTINGSSGTITGDAFDKSLFAVMTPYILAIEG